MNALTPDQFVGALIVISICVAMFAAGMDKPRNIKKIDPNEDVEV